MTDENYMREFGALLDSHAMAFSTSQLHAQAGRSNAADAARTRAQKYRGEILAMVRDLRAARGGE